MWEDYELDGLGLVIGCGAYIAYFQVEESFRIRHRLGAHVEDPMRL